jgi:DNA polymerase III subunit delta'
VSKPPAQPAPGPPEPRRNPELLGHHDAAQAFARAAQRGKLHHAWLVAGPPGIGKATFAWRAARWLLAGQPETRPDAPLFLPAEHPVFRRAASGGHSDLRGLERLFNPKTKRMAGELTVDQVRGLGSFMRLTPGEGVHRIVIVDTADEMNTQAANALLKLLEEPPPSALLFLLSHAPGSLLPTIRSRCRLLRLAPVPAPEIEAWLARWRPASTPAQRHEAAARAQGSPGAALARLEALAGDGFDAEAAVWRLLDTLPKLDRSAAHALAQRVGKAGEEELWTEFFSALGSVLASLCAAAARQDFSALGRDRAKIAERLASLRPVGQWAAIWQAAAETYRLADTYNLDRRATAYLTLASLRPGEKPYTPADFPAVPA